MEPLPKTREGPIIVGGGKYLIRPDAKFLNVLRKIHLDPAVYGDDVEVYRPERMLDEEFNKLPKNAWKVRLLLENLNTSPTDSDAICSL